MAGSWHGHGARTNRMSTLISFLRMKKATQYWLEWNIPTISSALSDQHCGEASKPSTNSDKTAAKIEAAPTLKPKENSNLTFFYKNLWNESIPPTFTITTFHLNYASQWLFELQMYELFMICNVTGVFWSHVLKASEKLAGIWLARGGWHMGTLGGRLPFRTLHHWAEEWKGALYCTEVNSDLLVPTVSWHPSL